MPADHYRVYVPNSDPATSLFDIYGNQFDGEFLGTPTANGGYEDLLPNGQYRLGLTGDGVAGGAFVTGFVVVPNGNIIYARPDATENPLQASTAPDGSLAKPYAALAPEVDPLQIPANPTHDPNGGANATANFFNFNPSFDRNGDGRFTGRPSTRPSSSRTSGPVVVVALPATPSARPDHRADHPADVRAPGSRRPERHDQRRQRLGAVQHDPGLQRRLGAQAPERLAVRAEPGQRAPSSSAVPTPTTGSTSPRGPTRRSAARPTGLGRATPPAGDWGGIVFRNFDNRQQRRNLHVPDRRHACKGVNGGKAISGADDALVGHQLRQHPVRRRCGPADAGAADVRAITLFNSRPTITNVEHRLHRRRGLRRLEPGRAISADFDSFREDDIARGPLIRRITTVARTASTASSSGPTRSGVAQQTDAILYPDNPTYPRRRHATSPSTTPCPTS